MPKIAVKSDYTCEFCNRVFKQEKTLFTHACEQRRRHNTRNEKRVQIAFESYRYFYTSLMPAAKQKTYDDFVKSQYYIGFVKFGNYCVNTNVVDVSRYMRFLIKRDVPLDKWPSDTSYARFLAYLIRIEDVRDALSRSVKQCIAWGEDNETLPNLVFLDGSANKIVHWIISGRMSPWMVYNSNTGNKFLEKLNSEQLQLIWDIIDPVFWQEKFKRYGDDMEFAKNLLKKGGW